MMTINGVTVPLHFFLAVKEIGTRELPQNRGPAIERYIKLAGYGRLGDPWCALFRDAMLKSAGLKGANALARSVETSKNFIKLKEPIYGCIVSCWRGSKKSGLGHTGFFNGFADSSHSYVSIVGGNESDMVREELYPTNARAFGVVGYYWPAALALPVGARANGSVLVTNKTALASTGKVV